ncbi:hypothetical protein GOB89_05440 [Escherichia coli]|nr:hypothetical protein [Escherichia coli]
MINLGDAIDKLIDIINRAFTAFAQFKTESSSFIMTLSLFKAPSSGGAFPFQRPAEIVGLPPFAMHLVYR